MAKKKKHYVIIERSEGKPFAIGPYKDEDEAGDAMDLSLLIEGLVEDDALDCYLGYLDLDMARKEFLAILIDVDNPDHFAPQEV